MENKEFETGEPMAREWTFEVDDGEGKEQWTSKLSYAEDAEMQFVLGEALYRNFFSLTSTNQNAKIHSASGQISVICFDDEGHEGETIADYREIVGMNPDAYERYRAYYYYRDMLAGLGYPTNSKTWMAEDFDPLLALQQISSWITKVKPLLPPSMVDDFQNSLDGLGIVRTFYQQIPHTIARSLDLDVYEFRALTVIRSYCWTNSSAYTRGLEELAYEVGCSLRKISDVVQSLVKKGYLNKKVIGRKPNSPEQAPNHYKPIDAKLWFGIEEFAPKNVQRAGDALSSVQEMHG